MDKKEESFDLRVIKIREQLDNINNLMRGLKEVNKTFITCDNYDNVIPFRKKKENYK